MRALATTAVAALSLIAASVLTAAAPIEGPADELAGNFAVVTQLEGAAIRPYDTDDGAEEFVLYTFGDDVRAIIDPAGFYVAGPDPRTVESAETARILEDDVRSVLVGFPAGTDLDRYSVAGIRPGIVRNVRSEVNLPTTIGLPTTSGLTTLATAADRGAVLRASDARPALVEVIGLSQTLNRATFVFSHRLDESGMRPERFGYYTTSGLDHPADAAISIEDERVVVEWDETDGDQVEDAVRFYVDDGAVDDLQGFPNLIGAVGGSTASPDLVAADKVTSGLWSFRFDEAVVPIDPEAFALYTQDGDRFTGTDFASVGMDTVQVVFRAVEDFADQVTSTSVSPGAVLAITANGSPNTLGSQPISGGVASIITPTAGPGASSRIGITAGPDLVDIESLDTAGIVRFRFDQPIDDDATVIDESFYLMTEAGEVARGRAVIEIDGTDVVALFDETLAKAAVAAGVLAGAVSDEQGNPNLDRALTALGGGPVVTDQEPTTSPTPTASPPTAPSPASPAGELAAGEASCTPRATSDPRAPGAQRLDLLILPAAGGLLL